MDATFDRSYTKDILPNRLEKYMKEFESDVNLSEMNIHDKTMLKPAIAAKWARFSYEEERYKKKLQDDIDAFKNKFAMELFNSKKRAVTSQSYNEAVLRAETEKYIKKNPEYIKMKDEFENQNDIIRFIIDARQIISGFGFDIKNAIDVLKLEKI